jgi:hypothetical protein
LVNLFWSVMDYRGGKLNLIWGSWVGAQVCAFCHLHVISLNFACLFSSSPVLSVTLGTITVLSYKGYGVHNDSHTVIRTASYVPF